MSDTPYVPGGPVASTPRTVDLTVRPSQDTSALISMPPSRAWRIVRMTLGVLGIIALMEGIVVLTLLLTLAGSVASRINDIEPTPDVGLTGCPFTDPADCGG